MPRLENPLTFKNVVRTEIGRDGKEKDIIEDVQTKSITDYFNPLKELPENPAKAKESIVTLTLKRGEIKDFSDDEADFLMNKYPWIKIAHHKALPKPGIDEVEEKARPVNVSKQVEINVDVDKL